ncbi:MAG: hypothetical protein ABJP82_20385 [Hyphomicrobiales bacterium]
MTRARVDLTKALSDTSSSTGLANVAAQAPPQAAQQVSASTYSHTLQEMTNATEVAVMEAEVDGADVVSKSELDQVNYQADIERAEQALRDAALLVNEARQKEDLMEIFQDAIDQNDEADDDKNDLQDNYLDGVQRFSAAETKLTFAEARSALEETSSEAKTPQVRSILI